MIEDDREKIFASIRRNLRGVEKKSAARNSDSPLRTPVGHDFETRYEKFKAELTSLGGSAALARDEVEISELIADSMKPEESVFIYENVRNGFKIFTTAFTESGSPKFELELSRGYDRHEAAVFDTAITSCLACVSETGSVVLNTGTRLPAGLAVKLIVLARESDLIPSLDELFTESFAKFKGSNMLIVTGPSRTADIEKELVTGVHGPKNVFVIFLKS